MSIELQPDYQPGERTIELLDGARDLNPNHVGQCYEYVYYHPAHPEALDEVLETRTLAAKKPVSNISSGFSRMEQGPQYALQVKSPRVKK